MVKCQGSEGYTSEFYKMAADYITPMLLAVYQGIWESGPYPTSDHQTYIKLIAKKDKDPTEPDSYRLISLLNINTKSTQTKPISPMVGSSNIRKVLVVLVWARNHPSEDLAFITLNAEKAFNNVSFQWLYLVLQGMGFSGPFQYLISSMYSAPPARVIAVGCISNQITLHKGTRQGYPLTLLLFNLAFSFSILRHLLMACMWGCWGHSYLYIRSSVRHAHQPRGLQFLSGITSDCGFISLKVWYSHSLMPDLHHG